MIFCYSNLNGQRHLVTSNHLVDSVIVIVCAIIAGTLYYYFAFGCLPKSFLENISQKNN